MKALLKRLVAAVRGEQKAVCKACGRELRAASSIERGMGSCCFKKFNARDTRTLDLFEAGTPGSELQ